MAECNLSISYANVRDNEKLVKLNYTSWCPTCNKDLSRRRTCSETGEPLKRKGKEMKTLTPKKYNRCREYENMELDYDGKDVRYDCCRVRSNLCELPTTYITNNCQMSAPMSNLQKLPNGVIEFDNMKSCDNYKLSDNITITNLQEKHSRNMSRQHDDYFKNIKPHYNVSLMNKQIYTEQNTPLRTSLQLPKLPDIRSPSKLSSFNADVQTNVNYKGRISQEFFELNNSPSHKTSLKSFSRGIEKTSFDDIERSNISYDTNTYFNQATDSINIKDRYTKEVELLRKKLRELRDKRIRENGQLPLRNTKFDVNSLESKKSINEDTVEIYDLNKELGREKVSVDRKSVDMKPSIHLKKDTIKTGYKLPAKVKIKVSTTSLKKLRKQASAGKRSTSSLCAESDSDSDKSDKEDGTNHLKVSNETLKLLDGKKESSNSYEVQNEQKAQGDNAFWPLRESLFPNIPPYIKFNSFDTEMPYVLPEGQKYLKWKLSTITPIIVRKTLVNTGFRLVRSEFTRESNEWIGTWGKHMKSPLFKTLKDTQKLNHFPGTFQIGRKDRLWRNLQRLIMKFGEKEFGFIPQTYILPQDLKLLKQNWEYRNGSGDERWIIKPPASARGVGIRVINKWTQLPKKSSLVVQKYISDPYLINGSKFDLRLYVLVTSFNPLRIYLYPDGLVRFASVKYSEHADDLKDRYMHLTNYSINKLSSQYTANEDANACQGHKWTLSKLWEYLQKRGINTKYIWRHLEELVIKTIISGESPISQLCAENINNRYNCYELFGVDVLLDRRLKPWLLEVNISPSLHSASPLDAHVKGPLVQDLFNIVQFQYPPKISKFKEAPKCYEPKIYTMALTKKERNKHILYSQMESREEYLSTILDYLTGDDVRHLTQAEDELTVIGKFQRIFPTSQTYTYQCFMDISYYNRLFDAWETSHEKNRKRGIDLLKCLCTQKIHLKVASQSSIQKVPHINNRLKVKRVIANKLKWKRIHLKREIFNGFSYKTRFSLSTNLKRRMTTASNNINSVQNMSLGDSNLQPSTDGQSHAVETELTKECPTVTAVEEISVDHLNN